MSGHNKWSKIKHKKAASDARKSKVFTKLVQLIQVESKKSNGDINSPGLKLVIERAKAENMPKENIERAIKKGASGDASNLEGVTYETYGPGGSAIVIEALTDNKNRTGVEIKTILTKKGLFLSSPGSALWAFEKKNGEWVPKTTLNIKEKDRVDLEDLIESIMDQQDVHDVFTNVE